MICGIRLGKASGKSNSSRLHREWSTWKKCILPRREANFCILTCGVLSEFVRSRGGRQPCFCLEIYSDARTGSGSAQHGLQTCQPSHAISTNSVAHIHPSTAPGLTWWFAGLGNYIQSGPPRRVLQSCMAALLVVPKKIVYNRTCLTASIHGSLTGNTPKNGRAWRADFSSDLRPFQGTILLHF